MLTAPLHEFELPPGWVAEPAWDGCRVFLSRPAGDGVQLLSRRRTDLASRFPEIVAVASRLPPDVLLDGELVPRARGPASGGLHVKDAAQEGAACFIVFDLLHLGEHDYLSSPYYERREALERLFADCALRAPWTLSPVTALADVALGWLERTRWGAEGVVVKNPGQRYLPGTRVWRTYAPSAPA